LFGFHNISVPRRWLEAPKWSEKEKLKYEQETLGLFLTGHPLHEYLSEIKQCVKSEIRDVKPTERHENITVAGYVSAIRTMRNKKGEKMAFISLDDPTGRLEVSLFAEVYAKNQDKVQKDTILIVEGSVSRDAFTEQHKMLARQIYSLDQLRQKQVKSMAIFFSHEKVRGNSVSTLEQDLLPFKGGNCRVQVVYQREGAKLTVSLGSGWRIKPDEALLVALRARTDIDQVDLLYQRGDT
jgi:DNA polymerase III subunit alpha